MPIGSQPDFFFRAFLEAIKPAIATYAPCPTVRRWMPYARLLGVGERTLVSWKTFRKVPEDAYQNASNLLALQEIAQLSGTGADLEDACAIARRRLTDALAGLEPPPARRSAPSRPAHGPAANPPTRSPDPYVRPYRWTSEEETWQAVHLHNQGLHVTAIARELKRDPKTIRRMLASVLGDAVGREYCRKESVR
jgi:hypothetical protein